jgi:pimeloyl-ACP methyl ester carboxylesterase
VIVETARQVPDRVAGLVWVDTYRTLGVGGGQPVDAREWADFVPVTRAFARRLFRPDADPDLVEWVAADMSAAPPEVAVDALRHAFANEPAVVDALPALKIPVWAINPTREHDDPASLERHGVTVLGIDGVGHFPMLEDPPAFNHLLERIVDRL